MPRRNPIPNRGWPAQSRALGLPGFAALLLPVWPVLILALAGAAVILIVRFLARRRPKIVLTRRCPNGHFFDASSGTCPYCAPNMPKSPITLSGPDATAVGYAPSPAPATTKFCPNGHLLDPSWDHCPYCEQPGDQAPNSSGRTVLYAPPPVFDPAVTAEHLSPIVDDRVQFTVTAASILIPDRIAEIYLWAHTADQRAEALERFREIAPGPILSRSHGPARVERGTALRIRLSIDGLDVPEPEETLVWDGEIANAVFLVPIPSDAPSGQRAASIHIFIRGLRIAAVKFVIEIGPSAASGPVTTGVAPYRKAFASYARQDRDEVLARIQGMQKVLPELEVFLDVVSLRSGEEWQSKLWQVIPEHDIFYLFWSANAKRSVWVNEEWRCAFETRGLSFIDPVPLESPDTAPPPPELPGKHFNDWVLAYMRR